ncbi:MAG: heme NO-binding domain-containing protein [Cyclobacteriaceae bacterium]|nr:heme NO-binding domain-containing protein [Cyclobacteriaceae bacterium]MCH8516812.1 heme NO-binding domain-containing protein [Cyclobacteriaceae bacterium]
MKGTIHKCLGEVITRDFGQEKWGEILVTAGMPKYQTFNLNDNVDEQQSLLVFSSCSKVLNKSRGEIYDLFGEYWICHYAPREYSSWYNGVNSSKDFIRKIDRIHVLVGNHFSSAEPPLFIVKDISEDILLVNYISKRGMIDLYISLVKGLGIYFEEKIFIEKVSDTQVKLTFG